METELKNGGNVEKAANILTREMLEAAKDQGRRERL